MKASVCKVFNKAIHGILFLFLFSFTVSAQTYTEPWIENISLVNTLDADNDGYYEQWSFEINVDALYQDQVANAVDIWVYQDQMLPDGILYGPYNFNGYDQNDKKIIGPFNTYGYEGLPAELEFSFTAENIYGSYPSYFTVRADRYDAAPEIVSVNVVKTKDADGDSWLEQFYFDVDIDPLNGLFSKDVYIDLKVDGSNTAITRGPFNFSGTSPNDKIEFGPFAESDFSNLPREISFHFDARNNVGSDYHNDYVRVDGSDNGPVIKTLYVTEEKDEDHDNFYEEWYLLVDVDNKTNLQLEEVSLVVYQGGVERYNSGPYTVEGISHLDGKKLGPFTYTDYQSNTSNLAFTVVAQHAYGNVQQNIQVPVDGERGPRYVGPRIESIALVNTTDADNDNYFESWSFKVDVDAIYQDDIASNVYLHLEEPHILPNGAIYGPYSFKGYNTTDFVTIGPFNTKGIAGLPANLNFSVSAENSYDTDLSNMSVPADQYIENSAPKITSFDLIKTVDADKDSWLEQFSAEIDVDPAGGQLSRDLYLDINLDSGNLTKTFGPYTVTGTTTGDKIEVGPFTNTQFLNTPREIVFDIKVYNAIGIATGRKNVKIDGKEPSGSAPTVSFNADKTSGSAPLTVQFSDQSLYIPTSWSWEFPGGTPSTSTLKNPKIVYSNPGSYTVKLTASNSFGSNVSSVSGFITVTSPPLSQDASLKSLTLSTGILKPGFSPVIYSYTVELDPVVNTAPTITAVPNSGQATVNLTYPADINSANEADRKASITVTADDGQTKSTYNLLFTKKQATVPMLTFSVSLPDPLYLETTDAEAVQGSSLDLGPYYTLSGGEQPYSYLWTSTYETDNRTRSNPVVVVDGSSTVYLEVKDDQGCVVSGNIGVTALVASALSAEEQQRIAVYPNPAMHAVIIEIPGELRNESWLALSVFDLAGRSVISQSIPGYGQSGKPELKFDISDLQNGTYILKFGNSDFSIQYYSKLIINK